jgi:tetratricopeptide (TPR) repeat protein
MAGTDATPERIAAGLHLSRARAHLLRRKADKALEEAHLALQTDPGFDEARYFLAEYYEQAGEVRKAVHEYEQLLFRHHGDESIIERVGRIDPMAAEKHRRLSHIAPDPFVAGRGGPVAAEEEGLGDFEEIDSVPAAEATAGPSLRVGRADDDAFLDIEDAVEAPTATASTVAHAAADVFADEEESGGGSRAYAPEDYEYEDERKFRLNASALEALKSALREDRRLWADSHDVDEVIARSTALTLSNYVEAADAFEHASALLQTPTVVPHVVGDPSLLPLICGPLCAYVLVPTAALETLTPGEMRFYAGRVLCRVPCQHVPLLDIAAAMLPAARPGGRLQGLLKAAALKTFGNLAALADEAGMKAKKALHIWRLRAELTADRAGLLVCGSLSDSLSAIAKLTAPDAATALGLSPEVFKHKFEGQDLRQISNIGPDRDPETAEPYAFYRMLMLSWWAKQPAYGKLTAGA